MLYEERKGHSMVTFLFVFSLAGQLVAKVYQGVVLLLSRENEEVIHSVTLFCLFVCLFALLVSY